MDSDGRPFTQQDHDRAVEVGGLWLLAVTVIALAIIVGCTIS